MPHYYAVDVHDTGLLSGALDAKRLEAHLNRRGKEGWRLVRTLQETRRALGLFRRETHFLVFEWAPHAGDVPTTAGNAKAPGKSAPKT